MNIRIIYIFALVVLFSFNGKAQDFLISQYNASPLTLNPSYAGSIQDGDYRVTFNNFSQWDIYNTMIASGDFILLRNRYGYKSTGIGMHFYRDKAGKSGYGHKHGGITISQSISANRFNEFSVGVQFSGGQVSGDFFTLRWDDQYNGTFYDQTQPSGEPGFNETNSYFDLSAGALWKYTDPQGFPAEVGFSLIHANQSPHANLSFFVDKLHTMYLFHANKEFGISHKASFTPHILFASQSKSNTIMFTGFLNYKFINFKGEDSKYRLKFGLGYRSNYAFIPQFHVGLPQGFDIGISYDAVTNAIIGSDAFGLSIKYRGKYNAKSRTIEEIRE